VKQDKKDSIFRQESLERLSSPERLDQLMQIVKPFDWLAIGTCGTLVLTAVVWSVIGRIPITVDGRGIVTQPRQVMDIQSTVSGQLQAVNVKSGQCVAKDEVLATVEPTELKKQMSLANQKLTQLRGQAQDSNVVLDQRMMLEREAIAASRAAVEKRLQDVRAVTPILRAKGVDAIREQRRSLEQRLKDAKSIAPVMQRRLQQRNQLADEGAIPKDTLLQVEQEFLQARQNIADIEAQLKQLDVQSTDTERQYLDNLRSAGDLQAQLQDLNTKGTRLDQETIESRNQRNASIQDVQREIAGLEQQIAKSSEIRSPQAGCVTEVTSTIGQVVQPGLRLGSLKVDGQGGELSGVTYFAVKDGKQIEPGMKITITPDTVQRERFGGIVAEVTSVSTLPVTQAGAAAVVGNPEVVQSLVGNNGAVIEINAKLIKDSNAKSGYVWSSSKGPESPITTGTTTTARVTVEERAPITFVLPILRELTGVK
jgi:HlyD family secretion protein